ncbi:hypothetical protein VTK26DRAFT_8168 [Humicola hyalothermophila]
MVDEGVPSRKVWTSAASPDRVTASMSTMSISEPPKTPPKQVGEANMGTPAVPRSSPAVGGMQNPATSDETYVNTALLLLLQTLTLSMSELGKSVDGRLDFGNLEWLADRLPLKMYRRQPPGGSEHEDNAVGLMEARVDGYLCRRDYHPPR